MGVGSIEVQEASWNNHGCASVARNRKLYEYQRCVMDGATSYLLRFSKYFKEAAKPRDEQSKSRRRRIFFAMQ